MLRHSFQDMYGIVSAFSTISTHRFPIASYRLHAPLYSLSIAVYRQHIVPGYAADTKCIGAMTAELDFLHFLRAAEPTGTQLKCAGKNHIKKLADPPKMTESELSVFT